MNKIELFICQHCQHEQLGNSILYNHSLIIVSENIHINATQNQVIFPKCLPLTQNQSVN